MPTPVGPAPTLAPPKPVELPAAPKPMTETKAPASKKPAEQPAAKAPEKVSLPLELPGTSQAPTSPEPAKEPQLPTEEPTEKPAVPREPDAKPVERPVLAPPEKPLIADVGNPFILETDVLQIWTDATGNYRLEARFVGFDETTVRLQRPNGEYIRVAYDRLSGADRERVRDLSQMLAMKMSMK